MELLPPDRAGKQRRPPSHSYNPDFPVQAAPLFQTNSGIPQQGLGPRTQRQSNNASWPCRAPGLAHAPSSLGLLDCPFAGGQYAPTPLARLPKTFLHRRTSPVWPALLPAGSYVHKLSRALAAGPAPVARGFAGSPAERQSDRPAFLEAALTMLVGRPAQKNPERPSALRPPLQRPFGCPVQRNRRIGSTVFAHCSAARQRDVKRDRVTLGTGLVARKAPRSGN